MGEYFLKSCKSAEFMSPWLWDLTLPFWFLLVWIPLVLQSGPVKQCSQDLACWPLLAFRRVLMALSGSGRGLGERGDDQSIRQGPLLLQHPHFLIKWAWEWFGFNTGGPDVMVCDWQAVMESRMSAFNGIAHFLKWGWPLSVGRGLLTLPFTRLPPTSRCPSCTLNALSTWDSLRHWFSPECCWRSLTQNLKVKFNH